MDQRRTAGARTKAFLSREERPWRFFPIGREEVYLSKKERFL
jgi:hypothetical protein